MPTVLRWGPYRAFFYSNEGIEPAHIHVRREDREVKFWLRDLSIAANAGFPFHEINDIIRHLRSNRDELLAAWHEHFEIDVSDLRARSVDFTDAELVVTLIDGRRIVTPLEWYPRLLGASSTQRKNFEIMAMGVHWPDLDEDLSIAGMLKGGRSR